MSATWPALRLATLTGLALLAFAGNSLLCRAALAGTAMDPASFTALRLLAGAVVLALLVAIRHRRLPLAGSWSSAGALFIYAAAFSWAYLGLSAGTGALLLFAAVQATMTGAALRFGERLAWTGWTGVALALAGLVVLLAPGLTAPALGPGALMALAGVAWAVYSLRGRGGGDPLVATAGNFLRSLPLAAVALLAAWPWLAIDASGGTYAVVSGGLTSGVGYALWYAALPSLRAITAATVQLSVPVLTALAGWWLLAEPLDLRLVAAGAFILGGIALVIRSRS